MITRSHDRTYLLFLKVRPGSANTHIIKHLSIRYGCRHLSDCTRTHEVQNDEYSLTISLRAISDHCFDCMNHRMNVLSVVKNVLPLRLFS